MGGTLDSLSPGLEPAPKKGMALNSNYLQFTDKNGADFSSFAEQYLPELYEAEVERYGNRTIGGFLRMVGAEMPMSSDQVIWSEQNRLHVSYDTCEINYDAGAAAGSQNQILITLPAGNTTCAIKKDQVIVIQAASGEVTALVLAEPTVATVQGEEIATVNVQPYQGANLTAAPLGASDGDDCAIFVVGSEYNKGSETDIATLVPKFTQYENKPLIIRDQFDVNGSDTAQIGWVEVATEDGTSGYLWYLKAESETRLRFEDYMEMMMMEAQKGSGNAQLGGRKGSEGFFAAVKDRGQIMDGFSSTSGGTGALEDFDAILKQLDKEGSIEENMLFLDRNMALAIDDMLAEVNGSSQGPNTGGGAGASFGLFNNEAEMALNLGFSGFRRGSYDFYKTDWKYLNDASTRGVYKMAGLTPAGGENITGALVPAGTSTVYDQIMGSNIRRPFLHVRYRANEVEDRRMKSWMTGSVGGAATSSLDAMQVHFLSERCLCVQAANNFLLFVD
tara:strand:- start:13572 stop:15083 length:1512 start_codon:yes stop_codon:yes gene_type:complete